MGIEIFLFTCFAIVQIYSFKYKDYEEKNTFNNTIIAGHAEFAYITLSLVAKSVLGISIFAENYTITDS